MLKRLRVGPVGLLVAVGTLASMAAAMVVASPGAAANPEKEYTATFEQPCVIAPGSLNIKGTLTVTTRSHGPVTVTTGEEFEAKEASSSITSPAELGNSLYADGVREVRGKILHFGVNGTGAEPAELNIAKPVAFPEGLPYHTTVEENVPSTFTAPSEGRTYPFGPYHVTAVSGNVTLATNTEPGYKEVSAGDYEATGKGVESSLEGYNAGGEKIIGPLTVACNAPAVTLATIPVEPTTTTTTSTSTPTTTTTSLPTTTTTTTEAPLEVTFHEWTLTGSITPKKIGEKISLPEGCKFNGKAFVPGALEANTSCPAFSATVKILGVLPSTIGLTFTETEPVKGTITPAAGGDLTLKATAKDNIGITSVTLLGLKIPTSCTTAKPVVFPLESTGPASELATGTTVSGETTLPNLNCKGGLLGSALGPVLSLLFSGPNNPFTFTIKPPA
jgi:hypothetical protein